MNAPLAGLLACVAVISMTRLVWRHRAAPPSQRARAWRFALLLFAQPVCAALLYFALQPPTSPGEAGTLTVLTQGARTGTGQGGDAIVALPEAGEVAGVERVPDLATALRRHSGMQRVRIVGTGLEPRDRDAVRGLAVAVDPAPSLRGVTELDAPSRVAAGDTFTVRGRLSPADAVRGATAELLDPAGTRVAIAPVESRDLFALDATARIPGTATFTLRVRDADKRVIDTLALPMQVQAQAMPRVLLLAGAPNPEVKYLRRWARDAGIPLQARMPVGGGVQLGDVPIALDKDALGRFDIVVLDERALASLGAGQRAALDGAVRNGLGVLVRVTATLSEGDRQRLRAWGFATNDGRDATDVELAQARHDDESLRALIGPGSRDQARRVADAVPELPALTRRTLTIAATDGVPLLRDANDKPLALWRAEGRGRVAVWPLTDTYRLVLAGRDDRYALLWSEAFSTLARAQRPPTIVIEGEARVGERLALCGVGKAASVLDPTGNATPLVMDPAARNCAAYWPKSAGWHRVGAQAFYVRARDDARALHANAVLEATQRLVADAPAINAAAEAPPIPGARWPWWLAWLIASAASWWFERSRFGQSNAARTPATMSPNSATA